MCIVSLSLAKETQTNEVTGLQPTGDLDINLKKALLNALAELENEERTNSNVSQKHQVTDDGRIFEKASASAVNFIAGPSTTTAAPTTKSATTSSENPVIVQKSDSVQQHTIFSIEPPSNHISEDREQIQTSASSSFTSSKEFLEKQKDSPKRNRLTKESSTQKPVVTTPSTTVTPTEESEAKVEDVQFFSAPLVAAFTVHQDELGLPRSVVPIYKQQQEENGFHLPKPQNQQVITTVSPDKLRFDFLSYQEQQRALEEQIKKLQRQQQEYREYLAKQQKEIFRNQQQIQAPLLKPVIQHPLESQNYFQNRQPLATQQTFVSLQPSFTLTPQVQETFISTTSTSLPPNGQQLPIKSAVDFNKNNYFLPFRYNTLLQAPPPIAEVAPQRTRIFRQELHTGNFLNTPVQQQQSQFPFYTNQQHIYRNLQGASSFAIQPPLVNQRLNDLLYHSGIGIGKQYEDLSIVSKVLALNRLRRHSFVGV